MILIDSDIAIDLFRGFPPALNWLESFGPEPTCISGYVAMELIQGCRDRNAQRRTERELAYFEIVWPDTASCFTAQEMFKRYHLSHGLGLLDALIGMTARAMNVPLHTFNTRHFNLISGLSTIQPYTR